MHPHAEGVALQDHTTANKDTDPLASNKDTMSPSPMISSLEAPTQVFTLDFSTCLFGTVTPQAVLDKQLMIAVLGISSLHHGPIPKAIRATQWPLALY